AAVELPLPGHPPLRPRAHPDPPRVEPQDRPEADAEASRSPGLALLARGVEREEVAARVLEAHAAAVVAAGHAGGAALFDGGHLDPAGPRVARILEELAQEPPRVGAVALRFDPRAFAKGGGVHLVPGILSQVYPSRCGPTHDGGERRAPVRGRLVSRHKRKE